MLYSVKKTSFLKLLSLVTVLVFSLAPLSAQQDDDLLKKVKAKLARVSSYEAAGKLKIDVPFIKAPASDVTVFFKRPDKFRVTKKDGISLLPKGGVSINLSTLLQDDNYTSVPAGMAKLGGYDLKVIKLLPLAENSEVVLTTLYIDEKALVVRKAAVTTRQNGSYDIELQYGRYLAYALPDKVVFTFDAREYKLPRGITFEYDKGGKRQAPPKDSRGRVEINYTSYQINKKISDAVFTKD